jgi:hypothetical protein
MLFASSGIVLAVPDAFGQGTLTPPGAPAATMKSLAQIEPRTPISSAPFTITNSGSYYLTTNLTVSSGNAITIATNGVTLDLGGFTIASTAASATGSGIYLNSASRNITILNGFIQGGVTNNGSGVYSGPGFQNGIDNNFLTGVAPVNTRVVGISVAGCLSDGIYLTFNDTTLVDACTVRTVGGVGIFAGAVKSSTAVDCGGNAIYGNVVSDSVGQCNGSGNGILAFTTANNCDGSSFSGEGVSAYTALNCLGFSSSYYGLAAYSAENCYGESSSSYGLNATSALNSYGKCDGSTTGLSATSAQNCYGTATGSGLGLSATTAQSCYGYSGGGVNALLATTAHNCYGYSNGGGTGVTAYTAENCLGLSVSGDGVGAFTAQNCYGQSTSGTGLAVNQIAIGCYGTSSTGTGLQALIGNSSHGVSTSGTAESVTYKYNMP